MYKLVSHIIEGTSKLKSMLEAHITNQGLEAIEKCSEGAMQVYMLNYYFK